MFHQKRRWSVSPVASAEELADKLVHHSWTLCTAFELNGYLFLNDATSEDGAQEYGVVKRPTEADPVFRQVESITFSWCDLDQARNYIEAAVSGRYDGPECPEVKPFIESSKVHSYCALCA